MSTIERSEPKDTSFPRIVSTFDVYKFRHRIRLDPHANEDYIEKRCVYFDTLTRDFTNLRMQQALGQLQEETANHIAADNPSGDSFQGDEMRLLTSSLKLLHYDLEIYQRVDCPAPVIQISHVKKTIPNLLLVHSNYLVLDQ